MSDKSVQTEEVTVTSNLDPQVVKTTTTKQTPVVGENPQKVFQKKKMIFQFNQVVWYIAGVIEILLALRFFLKVITSNSSGFTDFIYNITEIFVIPFKGIVASTLSGTSTYEWATAIAFIIVIVIALLVVYLIDLIRPVSPEQIRDAE